VETAVIASESWAPKCIQYTMFSLYWHHSQPHYII